MTLCVRLSPAMEIEVGCVVSYAIGKSGIVRFVGETEFAQGEWVGIELDRPDGKNNGELNGKVYFTCSPNHGLFCKKAQVCVAVSTCVAVLCKCLRLSDAAERVLNWY